MTKYRAKRTKCLAAHTHDSKKEAARCDLLMLLFRAGQIQTLELQPEFRLHAYKDGTYIGTYRADFAYFDGPNRIVEDVKSPATRKIPLYRWKKKHAEAEYKIHIREV